MKRILIATDGSAGSHDAVEVALDLAGEHEATVFVVHVVPNVDVATWSGFGMAAAAPHDVNDRDRAPIEDALLSADERGVRVVAELVRGNPIHEIVAFADAHDVDLHRDRIAGTRSSRQRGARERLTWCAPRDAAPRADRPRSVPCARAGPGLTRPGRLRETRAPRSAAAVFST